jgi:hypothetical protein
VRSLEGNLVIKHLNTNQMGIRQRGFKYTEHKPFGRRYLGVTCTTMSSAVPNHTQVKARFSIDPTLGGSFKEIAQSQLS